MRLPLSPEVLLDTEVTLEAVRPHPETTAGSELSRLRDFREAKNANVKFACSIFTANRYCKLNMMQTVSVAAGGWHRAIGVNFVGHNLILARQYLEVKLGRTWFSKVLRAPVAADCSARIAAWQSDTPLRCGPAIVLEWLRHPAVSAKTFRVVWISASTIYARVNTTLLSENACTARAWSAPPLHSVQKN